MTAVAAALYAVPLTAFIAERTARAKAARAEGNRDLAARITALPKPSASAWLVNRLAILEPGLLDRVVELGATLRAAQEAADGERLRALATERRALLAELTATAEELAGAAGQRAGPAALEEFQQTLQAAVVSEEAAAAIRPGRLVRALKAGGLDPVDLAGAVALPGQLAPSRDPAPTRPVADDDGRTEEREEAERNAAERNAADTATRAQDLRRAADEAQARADAADAVVVGQEAAAADLRARLDALRSELEEVEAGLQPSRRAAAEAQQAHRDASRAAAGASSAADEAAAALRRLTG